MIVIVFNVAHYSNILNVITKNLEILAYHDKVQLKRQEA
jgi:hypothetical protein